ncbi:MAG TPA: acyl-CoA dehydrogenase family protein [Acidimicrobiales bacterium]|nr:acyl-CoA dehydrogenase family protein [Acidimicrobiales bacterium]
MDVDLTSDQELLRDTTARFIEAELPLDEVRRLSESGSRVDGEYLRRGAELGWFSLLVPAAQGGGSVSGEGLVDAAVVAGERGRFLQPGAFVAVNVVAHALATAGSPEQRREVLPALMAGAATAAWAVADIFGEWRPDAGVVAAPSGDGFVLSGAKGLVHDAAAADWLLVGAASNDGPVQVLLPSSAPGLTVTELDGLDITRRFSRVTFDDVVAPGSSLVGDPADAVRALDRQLQLAAVLTVAESVGAMDRIFGETLDYAKSRIAFGRPIGSFQAVKHLLADTSLLLEASRAAAVAAARCVQREGDDAAEVASIAKAFVGDSGIELAQSCLQVLGGIGFTWEHDLHLYLRRLTTDAYLYGEPAWHRERICTLFEL